MPLPVNNESRSSYGKAKWNRPGRLRMNSIRRTGTGGAKWREHSITWECRILRNDLQTSTDARLAPC